MFYTISLYVALVIFGLGLIYKVSNWFRLTIGMDTSEISASARIAAAVKGIGFTLLSPKILTSLRVLVCDVIFLVRALREDFLRWLMHMCIFGGFMLLLLFHALDTYITSVLFPGYYPTLNPFMFLRDLFGALVIIGIGIAIYRRFILKVPRLKTTARDHYAITILAVIMISGFLLHTAKIVSHSRYQEMVEDYLIQPDEEELESLEAYWVKEFGLVSPDMKDPFAPETLELGREVHETSCMECHSRPQWSFVSYASSKIIRPIALVLDRANVSTVLWHIHFFACLLGLAYLPFSRMFHMFVSPLSLLTNAVMDKETSDPANIATRQIMELDACTHCGTCTLRCAVGMIFEEIPNVNILPSEKIASIKALAAGKKLSTQEIRTLQQGMYLCTNCYRCTVACPVGINLQDLWFNVRETLLQKGYPEFLMLSPFSLYRGLMKESIEEVRFLGAVEQTLEGVIPANNPITMQDATSPLVPGENGLASSLRSSAQANNFSRCYCCVTCSNACPVVRNYQKPSEVLGLLPHQIMHAIGLRLWDLVFSSKMLWDCLGCYHCQEHCPQNVCVADVIYELKNIAIRRAIDKLSV